MTKLEKLVVGFNSIPVGTVFTTKEFIEHLKTKGIGVPSMPMIHMFLASLGTVEHIIRERSYDSNKRLNQKITDTDYEMIHPIYKRNFKRESAPSLQIESVETKNAIVSQKNFEEMKNVIVKLNEKLEAVKRELNEVLDENQLLKTQVSILKGATDESPDMTWLDDIKDQHDL